MMPAIFVHVSDIHFGQERDHSVHIHDDVKTQLIEDAADLVASLPGGVAQGILVTGDIAYSGTAEQYDAAALWLDELAKRIGCPIHRVQMVPGNHDLDRNKLSVGGTALLDYIRGGGAAEYEKVISNPSDRATLLARFEDYNRFSFGYRCGLDDEAKFASNLRLEVGPNRWIRFVRLNSSLLCTGREKEDDPELMIGSRQFTLPRHAGEENVVLVHHPLHWYKDADEVRDYIRSRSRVFISGHEHDPKVNVLPVSDGCDVMMLAAGAAVRLQCAGPARVQRHSYEPWSVSRVTGAGGLQSGHGRQLWAGPDHAYALRCDRQGDTGHSRQPNRRSGKRGGCNLYEQWSS